MRRSRSLAAGVVLAGATAAFVACGGDPSSDRGATARMFLETCAPGEQPEEEDVCRCAFERLTDGLSDEGLEDLDRRVRGEPEDLPDDVIEATLACAAEPLTPPTPKPTTTTTDPESSTTTTERDP